jgi:hypothetical protein
LYSLQDSKAREIKVKLAEAKWMIYLKGVAEGTMWVGVNAGFGC